LIKTPSLRNIADRMKHLARVLLVFLMALAVPLQGALAVTGGQCMALENDNGAPGDHDHASHSHAVDSHTGEAGTVHDHAHDGAGTGHCGPCTACCASASIGAPESLNVASTAAYASYVFSQFPPIAVQPGGVDRPPLAL